MTHIDDGSAGINREQAEEIIRNASTGRNLIYQGISRGRPTFHIKYKNKETGEMNNIAFSNGGNGTINVFHIGPGGI